jgi:FtsP/CotA-like multicopper oxidase with cupredoxin domain
MTLRRIGAALVILAVVTPNIRAAVAADEDENTGFDWKPVSTAAQPCGQGLPPRGHFPREAFTQTRPRNIRLTVRQDGMRLCYVVNDIAEAPLIRIGQGETFQVTLRNEITDPSAEAKIMPIGTLDQPNPTIPKTANMLPVESGMNHPVTGRTNLHVHGFSVPPTIPADEVLHGCVDPAVGPASCGRRELTYTYQIPADMPPGLYWYHPHVHGEVQAQMLMGLSGPIVVEGPDDKTRREAEIPDRIFVVRQRQDNDANPAGASVSGPRGAIIAPPPATKTILTGPGIDTKHELACTDKPAIDEITLNDAPVIDGTPGDDKLAPLQITQGGTEYWRVLNAATDAFLDLVLVDEDGTALPIRVAARDGAPIGDDTSTTEPQLVPPGGRVEFYVTAPKLGHKAYFVSHAVDTGCAGDRVPERRLAVLTTVELVGGSDQIAPPPTPSSAPSLFSGLLTAKTDRERTIAFAEYPRPGTTDQTDFYIAERRPGVTLKPYHMGGAPIITVPADAVEEWVVENWTNEVHAFHIHQVHFRVLEMNGRSLADPPLLDTITVPAVSGGDVTKQDKAEPGRVRIKLAFPAALAGDIPFHCHLVDHEDAGMMGVLRVATPQSAERKVQKAELAPEDLGTAICRTPSER